MKEIKKLLSLIITFMIYLGTVFYLLRSFYIYQSAYHALSRLVSHPSIEVRYETEYE